MARMTFEARIAKAIETVAAGYGKTDALASDTAIAILTDASPHGRNTGNVAPLLALFNVLPRGEKRIAFVRWLNEYSPVLLRPASKAVAEDRIGLSEKYKAIKDNAVKAAAWNIADATATPFTALADKAGRKAEEEAFSFAKGKAMLAAVLNRMEKAANENGVADKDREDVNAMVAGVRKAIAA